jgi:hypothetical protein
MNEIISILFLCCHFLLGIAQQDSTKLPFAIAGEKKLSDEDLAHKKEGFYITGIPQFSSDPVNGFGYGAEGLLYFNGKKQILFLHILLIEKKYPFLFLILQNFKTK